MSSPRKPAMISTRIAAAVVMTVAIAWPGSAHADTTTTAHMNGDWSNAATWLNGVPNSNTDVAIIGDGGFGPINVFLSGNTLVPITVVEIGENPTSNSSASGTLDLHGYNLTAAYVELGDTLPGHIGTIARSGGGTLTLNGGVNVDSGGNFSCAPGDTMTSLQLDNGSSATIVATSNVTQDLTIRAGCTVNLQANLSLSDTFSNAGVINTNGHIVTAATADFSSPNGTQIPYTFGTVQGVTTLSLEGAYTTFNNGATVQSLNLSDNGYGIGSKATTTTTGDITQSVTVSDQYSSLTLGADLILSNSFTLYGTLNANGHAVSAPNMILGYTGAYFGTSGTQFTINNRGPLTATNLSVAAADTSTTPLAFNLTAADQIGNLMLYGVNTVIPAGLTLQTLALHQLDSAGLYSTATVPDPPNVFLGLTLSDTDPTALTIDPGNDLILQIDGQSVGWALRWANPAGGDHIADLQALINGGEITFDPTNGGAYYLVADPDYTYVSLTPSVVPEPSTLLLTIAAAAVGVRRYRKMARPS